MPGSPVACMSTHMVDKCLVWQLALVATEVPSTSFTACLHLCLALVLNCCTSNYQHIVKSGMAGKHAQSITGSNSLSG